MLCIAEKSGAQYQCSLFYTLYFPIIVGKYHTGQQKQYNVLLNSNAPIQVLKTELSLRSLIGNVTGIENNTLY